VLHNGKGERIRLHGIDCPEKRQAFGNRAKQFTSKLVFGNTVTVQVMDRDRYGRTVGVVLLPDGRSLNHELVRAGLAWMYRRYTNDQSLSDLEAEARVAGRGLWALNQVGGMRATGAKGATRSGRDERQPEELATVEQIRMIHHLFDDLQIAGVGLARMNFCRRVCKQPWPQTRPEANKVVEALKAMRARGWRSRDAQG